jgi:hypothetical protein
MHSNYRILAAALLCGLVPASAGPSGAHDKFSVLDLKIGMTLDGQKGFACIKPNEHTPDPHCVKFVDSRCAGKPAAIGQLAYGEKAPKGCYLDYSSNATFLDGALQQTSSTGSVEDERKPIKKPLENVHLVGTQSNPSKIYRIDYMLGFDDLAEGSKLYKATTAKYGEPSYKNPPNEMRWKDDTTKLSANCDRASCEIRVEDSAFEQAENEQQKQGDTKSRHQSADAPKL